MLIVWGMKHARFIKSGVKLALNYYLQDYACDERAGILAKMIFNGGILFGNS
jgi:hypothetical protein